MAATATQSPKTSETYPCQQNATPNSTKAFFGTVPVDLYGLQT